MNPLTVRRPMNKPSQSHRKEALDGRKWGREGWGAGGGFAKYTHLASRKDVCLVSLPLWLHRCHNDNTHAAAVASVPQSQIAQRY